MDNQPYYQIKQKYRGDFGDGIVWQYEIVEKYNKTVVYLCDYKNQPIPTRAQVIDGINVREYFENYNEDEATRMSDNKSYFERV